MKKMNSIVRDQEKKAGKYEEEAKSALVFNA